MFKIHLIIGIFAVKIINYPVNSITFRFFILSNFTLNLLLSLKLFYLILNFLNLLFNFLAIAIKRAFRLSLIQGIS